MCSQLRVSEPIKTSAKTKPTHSRKNMTNMPIANYRLCPNLKQSEHFDSMPACATWPFFFVHLLVIICRLARPGGIRSVIVESVLVKHQLVILNRSRERASNLRRLDRIITGLCTLLMRPARVIRSAIVFRPSTVFHLTVFSSKENIVYCFAKVQRQTGTEGAAERTRRCNRRDEGAQSLLGLPSNCGADYVSLRPGDQ